jgi:hypothetical protein
MLMMGVLNHADLFGMLIYSLLQMGYYIRGDGWIVDIRSSQSE